MKRTAFASLFALALAAGAAHAETGNVVGGGGATLSGGGGDMAIIYGAGGGSGVLTQSGRLAGFAGGHGEGGLQVEYLTPAVSADPGREAWLLGGGDNAEVVYGRRR